MTPAWLQTEEERMVTAKLRHLSRRLRAAARRAKPWDQPMARRYGRRVDAIRRQKCQHDLAWSDLRSTYLAGMVSICEGSAR